MHRSKDLFRSTLTIKKLIAKVFLSHTRILLQDQLMEKLVQAVTAARKKDELFVISLIGGAASGKSVLTQGLVAALRSHGIAADRMTVDDYNKGDRAERHLRYEGLTLAKGKAILKKFDEERLNELISRIRNAQDPAQTVAVPTYNELTGKAIDVPEAEWKRHIGPVDILIIEGDFNLVTESDLIIYVHLDDYERMFWRTRRDIEKRNESDPSKIRESFVLRQEIQHFSLTLPVATQADILVVCDSAGEEWKYQLFTRDSSSNDGNVSKTNLSGTSTVS